MQSRSKSHSALFSFILLLSIWLHGIAMRVYCFFFLLIHPQIDLGDVYKVTGVATQGGDGLSEWVTSFKLEYTTDGSSWQYYGQVSDSRGNWCHFNDAYHIYLHIVLCCSVQMTL